VLYPLSYEGVRSESNNAPLRAYPHGMPVVLVVDDEPIIVRLLEVNLRAAGYEVRSAPTLAAAVASCAERRPDAVIADLGLPDAEPGEVVERLRSAEGMSSVPLVVVSGADRDPGDGAGYAAGVEAFLTKPVEPSAVVDTVRRLTRRDG
jgi:two-component system KDP operon response regulator KdpE